MMKAFFKNLSLFAFVALFFFSLVVLSYNYLLEKDIEKAHQLRPETQILAMGDSHPECAINDIKYPIFENRARSAEIYYLTYYKLKFLLENDKNREQLKVICLAYNCFSLGKNRQNLFIRDTWGDFFLQKYLPIWRCPENYPSNAGYPLKENRVSRMMSWYMPDIVSLKDLLLHGSVAASFLAEYKGSFLSEHKAAIDEAKIELELKKMDEAIAKQSTTEYFSSTLEENTLRRIAALAKEYGIPLVLFNTPEYKIQVENTSELAKAYHAKFAADLQREYGVYYLNYHDRALPDSCFYDFGHLNVDGANVFTPLLLEDLRKLGLID